LGLAFECLHTGYGELEQSLQQVASRPVETRIGWTAWPR